MCLPWQAEARGYRPMSLRDRVDPVRIMTIIFATVFVAMILWIAFQEM
jgi:hypothetical protein